MNASIFFPPIFSSAYFANWNRYDEQYEKIQFSTKPFMNLNWAKFQFKLISLMMKFLNFHFNYKNNDIDLFQIDILSKLFFWNKSVLRDELYLNADNRCVNKSLKHLFWLCLPINHMLLSTASCSDKMQILRQCTTQQQQLVCGSCCLFIGWVAMRGGGLYLLA